MGSLLTVQDWDSQTAHLPAALEVLLCRRCLNSRRACCPASAPCRARPLLRQLAGN